MRVNSCVEFCLWNQEKEDPPVVEPVAPPKPAKKERKEPEPVDETGYFSHDSVEDDLEDYDFLHSAAATANRGLYGATNRRSTAGTS